VMSHVTGWQVRQIVPTGLVSYKYSTRKGLSTKVLATFDVAMPDGARREAGSWGSEMPGVRQGGWQRNGLAGWGGQLRRGGVERERQRKVATWQGGFVEERGLLQGDQL